MDSQVASLRQRLGPGIRAGLPLGLAALLISFSFGVLARPVMGPVAPIVMSVIVFAGSAQFAALAVLSGGGSALAAIVAGVLLNLRFGPMGIALGPSLRGGRLRRGLTGQAVVDGSWALANRGGGRFDADFLLGATLPQYPGWVLGTVLGVLGRAHRRPARPGPRRGLSRLLPSPARPRAARRARARRGRAGRRDRPRAAALRAGRGADPRRLPRRGRRPAAPVSAAWVTVGGLAIATALIKAAGPVLLGGRYLPPLLARLIAMLPAALLAALVVTESFTATGGQGIALDARGAGLLAAAAAIALRAPIVVIVVVAAVAAAAVRALG